ncbi:MAG: class IV adenylate cyclase [Phycisphaerae bacterium]|nr:class IV adenylate cyclase [Phycisphaerae bacterium]NUQ46911.1 class IV adenylate cyclase [Phycisphaerae bacterium]
MPIEIEVKLRVASHDELRARLAACHGTFVEAVVEVDRFFDRPDGALRRERRGLRLRERRRLQQATADQTASADSNRVTLTYKGPPQAGPYKSREEIETGVAEATAAAALLNALGFHETLMVQKQRERWRWGDCAVELDDVVGLGRFVEIEGPHTHAIDAALATLGLSGADHIAMSYAELFATTAADSTSPWTPTPY